MFLTRAGERRRLAADYPAIGGSINHRHLATDDSSRMWPSRDSRQRRGHASLRGWKLLGVTTRWRITNVGQFARVWTSAQIGASAGEDHSNFNSPVVEADPNTGTR